MSGAVDCLSCKWCNVIPGSDRVGCIHPGTRKGWGKVLNTWVSGSNETLFKLVIVVEQPAGTRGKFPINFDPEWIQECNGYT